MVLQVAARGQHRLADTLRAVGARLGSARVDSGPERADRQTVGHRKPEPGKMAPFARWRY